MTNYREWRENFKDHWETAIYTNAVDLAKKIKKLDDMHVCYEIEIVKGIDGENVVKVSWDSEFIERYVSELSTKIEKLEEANEK